MITYEDFQNIEIRVGTIRAVEKVPETDKLLKLTVDLGEEEPRCIVSGIAAHFENLEDLVGVSCAFVTNLEPRSIRGVMSNGMILAAGIPGESFSLLRTSEPIAPGTRIK